MAWAPQFAQRIRAAVAVALRIVQRYPRGPYRDLAAELTGARRLVTLFESLDLS
jgi:hypothetical protein